MTHPTEKMIASAELGSYIHRAVVRFGSKTVVGELAGGVSKKVMQMITSGHGDTVERSVLSRVVTVCSKKMIPGEVILLRQLIDKIHPVSEAETKIANPLTHVGRSLEQVGSSSSS